MNYCPNCGLMMDGNEVDRNANFSVKLADLSRQLAAAINDIKHPSVCECCKHCGECQGDDICIDNGHMNFEWRGSRMDKRRE